MFDFSLFCFLSSQWLVCLMNVYVVYRVVYQHFNCNRHNIKGRDVGLKQTSVKYSDGMIRNYIHFVAKAHKVWPESFDSYPKLGKRNEAHITGTTFHYYLLKQLNWEQLHLGFQQDDYKPYTEV
jgi:hypothetical protein